MTFDPNKVCNLSSQCLLSPHVGGDASTPRAVNPSLDLSVAKSDFRHCNLILSVVYMVLQFSFPETCARRLARSAAVRAMLCTKKKKCEKHLVSNYVQMHSTSPHIDSDASTAQHTHFTLSRVGALGVGEEELKQLWPCIAGQIVFGHRAHQGGNGGSNTPPFNTMQQQHIYKNCTRVHCSFSRPLKQNQMQICFFLNGLLLSFPPPPPTPKIFLNLV